MTKLITNKVLPYFGAEEYSILGNNSSNNTTAFQAAIDAIYALGGGTLHLKRGIYLTGALTHKAGVRIIGEDRNSTVIKLIASTNSDLFTIFNGNGAALMELTLDGNGTNGNNNSSCINITADSSSRNADNLLITNNTIKNAGKDGIKVNSPAWSFIIRHNGIYDCGRYGINNASTDNGFEDNNINNCGYGGFFNTGNNTRINGGKITSNGISDTNSAGIILSSSQRVTLSNVECQDNYYHGFLIDSSIDSNLSNVLADGNGRALRTNSGATKGYGFKITNSTNITIQGLATNYISPRSQWADRYITGSDNITYNVTVTTHDNPGYESNNGTGIINQVNQLTATDVTTGNTIRLIGDSLMEGSYGTPIGFANLGSHVKQIFGAAFKCSIIQHAVSGSTSTDMLAVINASSDYLLKLPTIIGIGTNDLDDTGAANNATQVALLKSNIAAMVAKLASVGNYNYLIIGVPNTQSETTAASQLYAEAYAAKLQYNLDQASLYGTHFFNTPAYFRTVYPAANGNYSSTLTTDGKHRTILGIQTEAAGILAHINAHPEVLFSKSKSSAYEKLQRSLANPDYNGKMLYQKDSTLTIAKNFSFNEEQGAITIGFGMGNKDVAGIPDDTVRITAKYYALINTNNVQDQNMHGFAVQFSGSGYSNRGFSMFGTGFASAYVAYNTVLGGIPALSTGIRTTTGPSSFIAAPIVYLTSVDGVTLYQQADAKGVRPLPLTTTARQALTVTTADKGKVSYDTTLAKLCVYTGATGGSGTGWEIITSSLE